MPCIPNHIGQSYYLVLVWGILLFFINRRLISCQYTLETQANEKTMWIELFLTTSMEQQFPWKTDTFIMSSGPLCVAVFKNYFSYTYSICNTLLSPIFKVPFFVARNQPHHTVYHELHGFFLTLAAYIYAFTVSICTTSKISAWRQGNTVTNCNNSRPGAIWIHDTGCYVLFLFSDSREQRQSIGMLYMDFKNRMLRPFIWCLQRDYSMPYGVNLFFKRHGAILKIAALRLYYTRIIDLLPLDFKRSFCWASVFIPKNLK